MVKVLAAVSIPILFWLVIVYSVDLCCGTDIKLFLLSEGVFEHG